MSIPEFLIASHIVPWAKNTKHRLNPRNGLCLNPIHDKAFDRGFITITPDFRVKISKAFKDFENDKAVKDFFVKFENQAIKLPDKFLPSKEFLDYHQQSIFKK